MLEAQWKKFENAIDHLAVGIALVDGLVVDVDLLLVILLGHRPAGGLLKGRSLLDKDAFFDPAGSLTDTGAANLALLNQEMSLSK